MVKLGSFYYVLKYITRVEVKVYSNKSYLVWVRGIGYDPESFILNQEELDILLKSLELINDRR